LETCTSGSGLGSGCNPPAYTTAPEGRDGPTDAATGVGAGDLAGGAFAGMKLGVAVLWAVVLGALFKFVITEGLARWQLATGTTLLEGASRRLGRAVQWFFLAYLLVWSFGVGTSLISACGVAAHAALPIFDDEVRAKTVFGIGHSLLGLALVRLGTFRFLERTMAVLVSSMIVIVLGSGLVLGADWAAVARGLAVPRVPDHPEGVAWTLALMLAHGRHRRHADGALRHRDGDPRRRHDAQRPRGDAGRRPGRPAR